VANAPVILLVLKDEKGALRLMVSPDLRTIVQGDDWAYLDPLLLDLQDRARIQPAALFKQLSSIGVGPLVTQEVGKELTDHPKLRDLPDRFIDLESKDKAN
jgi:hypothetical protein